MATTVAASSDSPRVEDIALSGDDGETAAAVGLCDLYIEARQFHAPGPLKVSWANVVAGCYRC